MQKILEYMIISTSPLHMKHKLNKTPSEVLDAIKESVSYARKFTDNVEWSCEDGTRTEMDFMCKTVELAIKCGAKQSIYLTQLVILFHQNSKKLLKR